MRAELTKIILHGLFRLSGVVLGMALLPVCAAAVKPDDVIADALKSAEVPRTQVAAPEVPTSAATVALVVKAAARRENLFKATSGALYCFTPAVRAAYLDYARAKTRADLAAADKAIPEEPVHENIRIEGNVFDQAEITAKSVKRLMIVGNKWLSGPVKVRIKACTDVINEDINPRNAYACRMNSLLDSKKTKVKSISQCVT